MTASRVSFVAIVSGIVLLVGTRLGWANDDLLSIGGCGLIVFGAMAFAVGAENDDRGGDDG